MNKQVDFSFAIKRVKDVYFYINEDLYRNDPLLNIKIDLRQLLGTNVDERSLRLTLVCQIHYADSEETLIEIHVVNVFEVPDLKKYLEDSFPTEFIISILGVSISHTRALLCKNLAGTAYDQVIIPITDPIQVAKQFYPGILEDVRSESNPPAKK